MSRIQDLCEESEKITAALDALSDFERAVRVVSANISIAGLAEIHMQLTEAWNRNDSEYLSKREATE